MDSIVDSTVFRLKGDYLDITLLHKTPIRICALASRLSHESWDKSSPETDQALLKRLIAAGDEHSKGLRGLIYILAIEAPRYWWVEMDTYTVGVIPMGSTSTMHKEAKKLKGAKLVALKEQLTEGTLQLRIRGFSWHTLRRIIQQRKTHRLPDWQEFCQFAEIVTVI